MSEIIAIAGIEIAKKSLAELSSKFPRLPETNEMFLAQNFLPNRHIGGLILAMEDVNAYIDAPFDKESINKKVTEGLSRVLDKTIREDEIDWFLASDHDFMYGIYIVDSITRSNVSKYIGWDDCEGKEYPCEDGCTKRCHICALWDNKTELLPACWTSQTRIDFRDLCMSSPWESMDIVIGKPNFTEPLSKAELEDLAKDMAKALNHPFSVDDLQLQIIF